MRLRSQRRSRRVGRRTSVCAASRATHFPFDVPMWRRIMHIPFPPYTLFLPYKPNKQIPQNPFSNINCRQKKKTSQKRQSDSELTPRLIRKMSIPSIPNLIRINLSLKTLLRQMYSQYSGLRINPRPRYNNSLSLNLLPNSLQHFPRTLISLTTPIHTTTSSTSRSTSRRSSNDILISIPPQANTPHDIP